MIKFEALRFTNSKDERGNVFFALFGAVAIVGVIGAASMNIMRGPMSTMVEVNKKTQAESEMQIAAKLAVIESVDNHTNINGEDCDVDGTIEPIPPRSGGTVAAPVGGGLIPSSFGVSKTDPWGTEYGYCAWDAGSTVGDANCTEGAKEEALLEGHGVSDNTYTVIAVISAGADRVFQTTCVDYATGANGAGSDNIVLEPDAGEKLVYKESGSDDVIIQSTYGMAQTYAGGLWTIKTDDADYATTDRKVEVTAGASFGGAIDLQTLGGALLLPDEISSGACAGNEVNDGVLRRNTTTVPPTVEICDFNGLGDWVGVSAGATDLQQILNGATTPTMVRVDDTVPEITFDVNGTEVMTIDASSLDAGSLNLMTSGDVSGAAATFSGALSAGATTLTTLQATGNVDFDQALDVQGNVMLGDGATDTVTITGLLTVNQDVDFDADFDVQGNVTLGDGATDTVTITGLLTANQDVDFDAALNVDGESDFGDTVRIAAPTPSTDLALDISGNIEADDASFSTVTITGAATALTVDNDASIGGTMEADDYTYKGTSFIPSSCGSNQKLDFESGEWKCEGYVDNSGDGVGGAGFVDLADTPSAYAGAAADANKVVTVNSAGTGLEFKALSGGGGGALSDVLALDDLSDVLHDTATNNNLFLGHEATTLDGSSPGQKNTAIGATALDAITTGDNNIAIGYNAGTALTTGAVNVFVGTNAGSAFTSGEQSVFVGPNAGQFATSSFNTAIGYTAGKSLSGIYSSLLGYAAGEKAGSNSTAVGAWSGRYLTGTKNVAIGYGAGSGVDGSTTAENSVFIGASAGNDITTGNNNIFMGYQAGDVVTTGADNIVIGYDLDTSAVDASNELNIGGAIFGDLSTGRIGLGVSDATAIDDSAILDLTSSTRGFLPPRVANPLTNIGGVGTAAAGLIAYNSTDDELQVFDGANWVSLNGASASAGSLTNLDDVYHNTTFDFDGNTLDDDDNLFIGHTAASLTALMGGGTAGARNTAIGATALDAVTEGNKNIAIGYDAGTEITTGVENTLIGAGAGAAITTGSLNVLIGAGAGSQASGDHITSVGRYSGRRLSLDSTAMGYGAATNSTASRSTFIGARSGYNAGNQSAGLGVDSLEFAAGTSNIGIGYAAGMGVDGVTTAVNSVFLGASAGRDITTGNNNIFMGYQAGDVVTTGGDNIVIGYDLDTSAATASNELNIGGAIFGDLSTGRIGLGVSDATAIDDSAILDLTSSTLGFLPPRMTDPSAITNEVAGLMAYDSDDNQLKVFDGTSWVALNAGSGSISTVLNDLSDVLNDTVTNNNLFIGHEAVTLDGATPGQNNTAIGATALDAVTTGDSNIAIGYNAGTAITTGNKNIFIGEEAASSISNLGGSVIIGYNAFKNKTGTSNHIIAIGTESLLAGSGDSNIAIGADAMKNSATSSTNVVIGNQALVYRSAGGSVIIGQSAATGASPASASSVNGSVIIGKEAGKILTGSANNVFLGIRAADTTTTGSNNIAIGADTDLSSDTASNELNIGGTIFGDLSTGRIGLGVSDATAIDTNAALEVTGTNLGFLPPRNADPATNITGTAGLLAYDSTDNVMQYYDGTGWVTIAGSGGVASLGSLDDLSDAATASSSNSMYIGHEGDTTNGDEAEQNVSLGVNALNSLLGSSTYQRSDANVAIGYNALTTTTDGFGNVAIGSGALETAGLLVGGVAIGYNAMKSFASGGGTPTAIGYLAMSNATSAHSSVAIGGNAFKSGATMRYTVAIGGSAMQSYTDTSGSSGYNVAIGSGVLSGATAGRYNAAVGYSALSGATTSSNNTAVGAFALSKNIAGGSNVAIGDQIMGGFTSTAVAGDVSRNVIVGSQAAFSLDASSNEPNDNVLIGYRAGYATTTGASNIVIGSDQDTSSGAADSELNIGGTIFGDLSTKSIGIGAMPGAGYELDVVGDLNVSGTTTNVSDRRLKKDIIELSSDDMVDRLMQVKTYSYKKNNIDDAVTEYGVMAQELEVLFPDLVRTSPEGEHYKAVNYIGLIAPMIEATKVLKSENDDLKQELASIKSQQAEILAGLQNMNTEVKGLKVFTGYGMQKAAYDNIPLLLLMLLLGGGFYVIGLKRGKAK